MDKKSVITQETVEEKSSPVSLKLLQGFKDDNNWLSNQGEGTVFLTRPTKDQFGNVNLGEGLAMIQVVSHTDSGKATRLFDVIQRNHLMVDTRRFSNRMELVEVLGQVGENTIDDPSEG